MRYLLSQPQSLVEIIESWRAVALSCEIHRNSKEKLHQDSGYADDRRPGLGIARNAARLPFTQQICGLVVDRSSEFSSSGARSVFCALTNSAGKMAFRKLKEEQQSKLVEQICRERWKGRA